MAEYFDYIAVYATFLGAPIKSGEQFVFKCWRCDAGKRTRHFYVNPTNGVYYCHHCGSDPDGLGKGNAVTFARIMGAAAVKIGNAPAPRKELPSYYNARKAIDVYNWIFWNWGLSDKHLVQLRESRGLKDPVRQFGLRSTDGLVDQLRFYFSKDYLVASGLFDVDKPGLPAHKVLYPNRVLIPYCASNDIIYIRSRAMGEDLLPYIGPKGVSCSDFIWGAIDSRNKEVIITEGEFKAMAAVQAGFHCVALPGMNCSHDAMVNACVQKAMERVIICFDSQTRKPENVDQAAHKLAKALIKKGIDVRRATLPLNGRDKVDIDEYLLYSGPKKFARVIDAAVAC